MRLTKTSPGRETIITNLHFAVGMYNCNRPLRYSVASSGGSKNME